MNQDFLWTSLACGLGWVCFACGTGEQGGAQAERASGAAQHTARTTLRHLATDLGSARIATSEPPASARLSREWNHGDGLEDFIAVSNRYLASIDLVDVADGRRVVFGPGAATFRVGGVELDVGELRFDEWDSLVLRARTKDRFAGVTVVANLASGGALPNPDVFFNSPDAAPPLFNDGSSQSYVIPLRAPDDESAAGTFESLALMFAALGPAEVDLLSVSLVPRGADFLEASGARNVARDGATRHTLFAHAPATLAYTLESRPGLRLDVGLGVHAGESVTYRVLAGRAELRELVFEERIDDSTSWNQRSIDLSNLLIGGGEPFELALEASSEDDGAVALWAAPILSWSEAPASAEAPAPPNVIFYVIDGGDANYMSLYGYDRPTTPFLEELATEGVLFTRAYANATWTQPSTVSFMTSLQHSVLGGLRRGVHSTTIPDSAVTMAEHFRAAGYQTASFTANPNAGRIIGTDQGVDFMRDVATGHHSTSSIELHEYYFALRAAYPGGPTWVHFQTTDVHEPNDPEPPFAGRLVSAERREELGEWEGRVWQTAGASFGKSSVVDFWENGIALAGIDRTAFYGGRRDLYSETMMHQDHALEELVAQLKERGEWENTLLVIGSDHGHPAGTFSRFGRGLLEPQPEAWQGAMCDAFATRIPLLFVWPARIAGGRRIEQPVSMIDVLPTLLELTGLAPAEVAQGRSLAPLLRGEELELPPVILDEFRVTDAGEWIGNLEIVDGRWGASLEIAPVAADADPRLGRRSVPAGGRWGSVHPYFEEVPRLLLYDLEADPYTTHSVHAEHPELVERYRALLLEQWEAHRALAQRFEAGEEVPITPEQLEQLRALGYIR